MLWVCAALAPKIIAGPSLIVCLLLTGIPAFVESALRVWQSRGRDVDVDALMTLAAGAAIVSGAALEGALLTTLYAVSRAVEHAVTAKARADLDRLSDLAPALALRLPAGNFHAAPTSVPVSDVQIGDHLLVRSGEIVPCDGFVADSSAFISVQHLTGETNPRTVQKGDAVPAGARTVDAPLVVRVSKLGAESTMARISRLVTSAQSNRPRVTRFFDQYSKIYTRIILCLAASFAVLLPPLTGMRYTGKTGSLKRSLGFLVASSPCALVVGAPVAYLATLSASARRGILVKSGPKALDATASAHHIVFDKTGTLTTGNLRLISVLEVIPQRTSSSSAERQNICSREVNGEKLRHVVAVAAALERGAVHPIANAIMKKASDLGLDSQQSSCQPLKTVTVVPGQGVKGVLCGPSMLERGPVSVDAEFVANQRHEEIEVRLGRISFAAPDGISSDQFNKLTSDVGSNVVTALRYNDQVYLFSFQDEVRDEAIDGVALLKKEGLQVSLLTGDGEVAAQLVADAVGGVDGIVCNATPESKLDRIKSLHSASKAPKLRPRSSQSSSQVNPRGGVVMVGDGVNDAPALAAATVGIACGLSSATAVQAADVVLVRTDLRDIAWYIRKSNATQTIVKQNLGIALGLMLVAVVPTLAGSVPLWLAVALHEGGTVVVGLNGLRLLSDRFS